MVVEFHQARSAINRAKPLNHRLEGAAPLVAIQPMPTPPPILIHTDSTLQQSVFCQLSLLFPLGSLKTPVNGSKLVLNLLLLLSKVCCFNILYQAGLPTINVWLITCYANLTSTFHPYQAFSRDLSVQRLGLGRWLEVL